MVRDKDSALVFFRVDVHASGNAFGEAKKDEHPYCYCESPAFQNFKWSHVNRATKDIHSDPSQGVLTVCFHDGKDSDVCSHLAEKLPLVTVGGDHDSFVLDSSAVAKILLNLFSKMNSVYGRFHESLQFKRR